MRNAQAREISKCSALIMYIDLAAQKNKKQKTNIYIYIEL